MTEILVSPDTVSGFKVTDVDEKDVSEDLKDPLTLQTPPDANPQLTVEPVPTDVTTLLKFKFTVTGAKSITTKLTYADGSETSPVEQPVISLFIHFT